MKTIPKSNKSKNSADTISTAVFAGSFNPFTIGHANIVDRALNIFHNVVIGIGVNIKKSDIADIENRVAVISELYKNNPQIEVKFYTGLTVDFARKFNNPVLIRGVRSVADFESEMQIADINRKISGIETILLPALPELSCISSSMVRELSTFHHDISKFIP